MATGLQPAIVPLMTEGVNDDVASGKTLKLQDCCCICAFKMNEGCRICKIYSITFKSQSNKLTIRKTRYRISKQFWNQ